MRSTTNCKPHNCLPPYVYPRSWPDTYNHFNKTLDFLSDVHKTIHFLHQIKLKMTLFWVKNARQIMLNSIGYGREANNEVDIQVFITLMFDTTTQSPSFWWNGSYIWELRKAKVKSYQFFLKFDIRAQCWS